MNKLDAMLYAVVSFIFFYYFNLAFYFWYFSSGNLIV